MTDIRVLDEELEKEIDNLSEDEILPPPQKFVEGRDTQIGFVDFAITRKMYHLSMVYLQQIMLLDAELVMLRGQEFEKKYKERSTLLLRMLRLQTDYREMCEVYMAEEYRGTPWVTCEDWRIVPGQNPLLASAIRLHDGSNPSSVH